MRLLLGHAHAPLMHSGVAGVSPQLAHMPIVPVEQEPTVLSHTH